MKQLNLKGKRKFIILAAAAAIMVIAVMVLAVGSLKKMPADSNLSLVRSGNTNISKSENRKQRLVVAADMLDGALNPLLAVSTGDQEACSLIFEPLAKKNPDGSFENVLAKNTAWDKTTLTLTIELKKDILFSDGSSMTADDVCASIGAYCLASYNLDSSSPYFNIKGAWDMNEQKAQGIEGIQKLDDHTVAVTFLQSSAKNWDILETPIQKNTFAAVDNTLTGFTSKDSFSKNAVGTGAYVFDGDISGMNLVLRRNSFYRESVKDINQIEFVKINFYDMQEALDAQNVDLVNFTANSEQFDMLYHASKYDIYTRPSNVIYSLGFNMNNVFLKEVSIRQAIAYALKYDNIVAKEWQDRYEPTSSIGYGTEDEKTLSALAPAYNKNKAEKILKELDFKSKIVFRLPVQEENEFQKTTASAIKKNLEAIGIQVEIEEYTDAEYVQALYIEDNFDLYLFTEAADYDWDTFEAFTRSRNGLTTACTDLTYTDAVSALSEAEDVSAYQTALKAAADKFYELVPAVPVARAKRYMAVSADLGGFRANAGETMITDVHEITSKAKEAE